MGQAGGLKRLLLFGLGIALCVLIALSSPPCFEGFCVSGPIGI